MEAVCSAERCVQPAHARGRCRHHYYVWAKANPDDVDHWPPIPDGLLDACTARLDAVRDGRAAEAEASWKLLCLIAKLP